MENDDSMAKGVYVCECPERVFHVLSDHFSGPPRGTIKNRTPTRDFILRIDFKTKTEKLKKNFKKKKIKKKIDGQFITATKQLREIKAYFGAPRVRGYHVTFSPPKRNPSPPVNPHH